MVRELCGVVKDSVAQCSIKQNGDRVLRIGSGWCGIVRDGVAWRPIALDCADGAI